MPKGFFPGLVAALLFLVLLLPAGEGRAQIAPSAPADTVVQVRVVGNSTVDTELVLRGFGVPVGSRFSADAVRRGIRRLHDLGFFDEVVARGERAPGGVVIVLEVTENPRVGNVEFSGNHEIGEKDLLEALGDVVRGRANNYLISRVQTTLTRLYHEKGLSRARIKPRYVPGASEAWRTLLVEIEEGPKVRVQRIVFEGLTRLEPGKLRGGMEQGTIGFLKGGVYKPEVVREDVPRIEAALAEHGFRDGKVLSYEARPGDRDDRVVLAFIIQEGPRYTVGAVSWEGNEAVSTPALYGMTRVVPGAVWNQERVERTVEAAYEIYSNQGYLYLRVQPEYAARDSVLDLTFRVQEGEPSHVRDIIITGNTRTKERVIRRQLAIKPGELFRRNLLVRSQRELQQLGFFDNLLVDSKPIPDSPDIDLILSVEERQVGTASAGFGYSSSVGLSGFLELGHSNLFGNAQSLNLRLERGSQRSNVELSFTEPWFRGTPTTVGADFYMTSRNYEAQNDVLDVELRRVGGALRMGRPLPIPFTRLFATYSLEFQEAIDDAPPVQVVARGDTTFFSYVTGLYLTQETASTSAISLSLVRNSTDHHLYPTVGSLSRFRAELSGGPLGGNQNFQKYELDVSSYRRLPAGSPWRPVFLTRVRLGAVGEGFRKTSLYQPIYTETSIPQGATDTLSLGGRDVPVPVPRYRVSFAPETRELFLLGGTNVNALRGYEDGEIAPEENLIRRYRVDRLAVRDTTTNTTTSTYNVDSQNVYFPGGKYMLALGAEIQFPIADPLHALFFFDVGGTWRSLETFRWQSLHRGAGIGLRMEVPLLGLIGFDYGYGFDRLDRATGRYTESGWEPHIQFGRTF